MTPQTSPPDPDPATSTRTRNAAATREAILQSALVAFTRHGYNGVGVREIARAAGVTAMLVNRYFGSKEQLFAEVVDVVFSESTIINDDLPSLSRVAVRGLVASEPRSVDVLLLMLRSIADPRATEILRRAIDERHRQLEALLPGAHAHERAALLLSLLLGVRVMQHMLASPTLAGAEEVVSEHLEAVLDMLVESR
jgi:AcrR family transcriptional regulator